MTKYSIHRVMLAAGVSVAALALAATAQAETLSDAIAMAYAQNPSIQKARAQQRATDEGYVQTQSEFGPAFSVSAEQDYTDHDTIFNPNRSTQSLSVNATQNLFTSGQLTSALEASKTAVQSGQQSLRSTELQLVLNVIEVYTSVRRDQEALQISQDNYDILKQQLDQTNAQFEAGQLTRTDVAQSQARLSASAASFAAAQAQLDSDRASYVQIVGQAPVALEAAPELPGIPVDYNSALDTAQTNNPDLAAAKLADDSAAARVKQARAVFGPVVGLTVSSGRSGTAGQLNNSLTETTAALRVSVPLFSSGLNGSRVREALENEVAARNAVEETRRTVVATVSQAWSNMIAAKSAVASNQEQVKAASVAADGVKTEQQVGLRTNIEVLNAEQELKSAQLDLVNAQRTQYVAAAQLLNVTGGLTAQALSPGIEAYDPAKNFQKVRGKGWTPVVPVIHAVDGLAEPLLGNGRK